MLPRLKTYSRLALFCLMFFYTLSLYGQFQSIVPLGMRSASYTAEQWGMAVTHSTASDTLLLDREYRRHRGANATFLVSSYMNDFRYLRDFRVDPSSVGLKLFTGQAEHCTLATGPKPWYTESDVSGTIANCRKELSTVIKSWARFGADLPTSTAEADIDDIVEDIFLTHQTNEGFLGWTLVEEVVGEDLDRNEGRQDSVGITESQCQAMAIDLISYTIERIRFYDPHRPIYIYQASHPHLAADNTYWQDSLDYNSTEYVKYFTDNDLAGWNVYVNFGYIKRMDFEFSSADSISDPDMTLSKLRWQRWHTPQRSLSKLVDDYACNNLGSYRVGSYHPEWWHEIGSHREWAWSNGFEAHVLLYRRPMEYEYRQEAFSALAAGAKGILLYGYTNTDEPWDQRIGPHSITWVKTGISEYEDDLFKELSPLTSSYERRFLAEGLIGRDLIRLTESTFTDSVAGLNGDAWQDSVDDYWRSPFTDNVNMAGQADDLVESPFYEEESRFYCPYDAITDLYKNLGTLLPIVRDLRWWWLVDGLSDTTLTDTTHGTCSQEISNAPYRRTGDMTPDSMTVADRFHLRDIESDIELERDSIGYSNIIVGLFTDPKDGIDPNETDLPEYYLVVNTRAVDAEYDENATPEESYQNATDFSTDTGDPHINLVLHDIDSTRFSVTSIWEDPLFGNYTELLATSYRQNGGDTDAVIKLAIDPGDAILLKVDPKTPQVHTTTTYDKNSYITGPKHYTGDVTVDCANVTFDGVFTFDGNLEVKGRRYFNGKVYVTETGRITLTPGSRLIFTDETSELLVDSYGELDVNGTASNPVLFTGTEYGPVRGQWQGIEVEEFSGDLISIEHATILNAVKGICNETNQSTAEMTLKHVTIERCTTGLYVRLAPYVELDSCIVQNCENGIQVSSTTAGNGIFKLMNSTVEDIDEIGLELSTVYTANIYQCLFQHIGEQAIVADAVSVLAIYGNGPPTIVRYCGQDALSYEAAIDIDDSDVVIFRYNEIYENSRPGLSLSSSSISDNSAWHNTILLANNSLKNPWDASDANVSKLKTELLLDMGFDLDTDGKKYDIFHDWEGQDDYYTASYIGFLSFPPITLDLNGSWWGPDIEQDTAAWFDHIFPVRSGSMVYSVTDPSDLADTSWAVDNRYWGLDSVDPIEAAMSEAYSLLDSAGHENEALVIFEELIGFEHVPALRGATSAMRKLGMEASEIETAVLGYLPGSENAAFERARRYMLGEIYLHVKDYQSAIDRYQLIANAPATPDDSLMALIQIQEAIRLEALFGIEEEGGNETQSFEDRGKIIALAEETIEDLYKRRLFNTSSSRNNRTGIPDKFELEAAYPNPFNSSIRVHYSLPQRSAVDIRIFNILGQQVADLVSGSVRAGYHTVSWQGRSDNGRPVASGLYFLQMKTAGYVQTKKILMIK